jgi:hypothetical protein
VPPASKAKASDEMFLRPERRRTAWMAVIAFIGLMSRGSGLSEVSLHGAFIGFRLSLSLKFDFGGGTFRKTFHKTAQPHGSLVASALERIPVT